MLSVLPCHQSSELQDGPESGQEEAEDELPWLLPPPADSESLGLWFSLPFCGDWKNELMPFCQSGVGLGHAEFPPAYLADLPLGELLADELGPLPPRALRGALAATTFLEAELDPPSAFVRTMIGLLFTAFPAFVDNSKKLQGQNHSDIVIYQESVMFL